MKINYLLSKLSISVISGLLTVSCANLQPPTSDIAVSNAPTVSEIRETPRQRITLNPGDLSNIDKLLLQANRANKKNKKHSLSLLETGNSLAEKDRKEGLHGQRDGLSKMFCAAAINYPTVDALSGCAESIVLGDSSFDAKVKGMKTASDIYRATLKFAERTSNPLPEGERQRILDNIKCLDDFVRVPNPNSPGCELVKISLTKAPGMVKLSKTGIVY